MRDGKPFAIMFSSLNELKKYSYVNNEEEEALTSWRKPIVILKSKKELAYGVSLGFDTIGAMLPYMPVHYLLFEKLKTSAIVLTSGNISDEPVIIDNIDAVRKMNNIADAILIYNRDISNRTDDSILININKKNRLIRRSRGYSPSPVKLNFNVDGIIATGAELVNCFCVGKGNDVILSQHIGDLKNYETYEFFEESIEKYKHLFRINPELMVCDLHPDYLSSKYTIASGIKTIKVQHHHAHIASCMAENNLDEKVIGISMDGTGLGDDNNIWGGEFLICDLYSYKRFNHFDYIPLPGGDSVTKEPWRTGLSYLYKVFGDDIFNIDIPFIHNLNKENAFLMKQMIDKKINVPLSSSAGRLFDSVAAITNLCTNASFHAEAPMRLEAIASKNIIGNYEYSIDKGVCFDEMIKNIVDDLSKNKSIADISAKFHNTIISAIFAVISKMKKEFEINKVVLSGGTFQNRIILEKLENELLKNNYKVYSNVKVPSNDGGIALGQIAIAAKRRKSKCV